MCQITFLNRALEFPRGPATGILDEEKIFMLSILAILFPIAAGIWSSVRRMDEKKRRRAYLVTLGVTDLLAVLAMFLGGGVTLVSFSENVTLSLGFDGVGRVVAVAVLFLYTAVTFYAFRYMETEEEPQVFFAFMFVSLGALIAVCASANLVTLYLNFELATLTSVPLVLHERTQAAVAAALKYLFYSVAGALMGLLGVFFVYYYGSGDRSFAWGGFLDRQALAGREGLLLAVVFIAIIGFGTKAGMYPMHGWLPAAHPIAPAPASALLSGIIAKAGVLAIIRLVFFSVGTDFLKETWVQWVWQILCMLTIFMGSMMAFREKVLKKRLAYSTVSQISYILLALSTLTEEGMRGGFLHLLQHAASKGCLFLAAGIFIYRLGFHNVDELKGLGRRMPVTFWCFLIAGLSLVGIPPMGGFLSKWAIASTLIAEGEGAAAVVPVVVLLISALLTAGYLLPVVVNGFFPGRDFRLEGKAAAVSDPSRWMTVPMICLCCISLITGLFGTQLLEVLL